MKKKFGVFIRRLVFIVSHLWVWWRWICPSYETWPLPNGPIWSLDWRDPVDGLTSPVLMLMLDKKRESYPLVLLPWLSNDSALRGFSKISNETTHIFLKFLMRPPSEHYVGFHTLLWTFLSFHLRLNFCSFQVIPGYFD